MTAQLRHQPTRVGEMPLKAQHPNNNGSASINPVVQMELQDIVATQEEDRVRNTDQTATVTVPPVATELPPLRQRTVSQSESPTELIDDDTDEDAWMTTTDMTGGADNATVNDGESEALSDNAHRNVTTVSIAHDATESVVDAQGVISSGSFTDEKTQALPSGHHSHARKPGVPSRHQVNPPTRNNDPVVSSSRATITPPSRTDSGDVTAR